MHPEVVQDRIFVIGYMHSGTTLLQRILATHSAIYSSRGETKFFDRLFTIRRAYPDLRDEHTFQHFVIFCVWLIKHGFTISPPATLSELGVSDRFAQRLLEHTSSQLHHAAIFKAVFDALALQEGKTRWLEKTPTHVFFVDEVLRSIPDARFVQIFRDPRDVLSSKKTRRATVWTSERYTPKQRRFKHLEKAYDPFWDSLGWKSAARAGITLKAQCPDRTFSLRYEDLTREPQRSMREVCGFLNVEFEPEMLRVPSRNSAEWEQRGRSGISGLSVGRWRRVLRPAEVGLCQVVSGAEMKQLRYGCEPVKLGAQAQIPLVLLRSVYEFGLRLMRRLRLGGLGYVANVLTNHYGRLKRLFVRP